MWGDYDATKEPPTSMISKKGGSSTLEQCGWCEHASGTHRYSYCIEGKCSLLSVPYPREGRDPEILWSTPCRVKILPSTDIRALIKEREQEIQEAKGRIERTQRHIEILNSVAKKATYRPPLPNDRPYAYFDIGDPIAVYYQPDAERIPIGFRDRWIFGTVMPGYRHQDGCVSFYLEGLGPQEPPFWGCGCSIPTILKREDHDWFVKHPEEFDAWKNIVLARSYNGETLTLSLPVE